MCLEYSGLIELYNQYGIKQLHLPTLDIHEPTVNEMKLAIQFINDILSQNNKDNRVNDNHSIDNTSSNSSTSITTSKESNSNPIVLIHCKGGRGRAVTTCLCYLISEGYSIKDGFNLIKSHRNVASEAVMYSYVVKSFEKQLNK